MSELRLYKSIYRVVSSLSGDTYSLVTPYSISASTSINSSTIETPTVLNESIGVYYVSLNPSLYSFDNIYDMNWQVSYLVNTPSRLLATKFRFQPLNVSGNISININKNVNTIDNIQIIPVY